MMFLSKALPRSALIAAVRAYRYFLSPWLGNACRFEPTCSQYALEALDRYGAAAGTYLAIHRLCRCQPWCAAGFDPVPAVLPRVFDRFTRRGSGGNAVRPASWPDNKTTP